MRIAKTFRPFTEPSAPLIIRAACQRNEIFFRNLIKNVERVRFEKSFYIEESFSAERIVMSLYAIEALTSAGHEVGLTQTNIKRAVCAPRLVMTDLSFPRIISGPIADVGLARPE